MQHLRNVLGKYFESNDRASIGDLIHAYGDPGQVLLSYRLFWPEFCAMQGHVLLRDLLKVKGGPEKVQDILLESENLQKSLRPFRSMKLPSLFIENFHDESHYQLLGELLKSTWTSALLAEFPETKFEVRLLDEKDTGDVLTISFEQLSE